MQPSARSGVARHRHHARLLAVQGWYDYAEVLVDGGTRPTLGGLRGRFTAEACWVGRLGVEDERTYVGKAVAFAADLGRLAELLASLRQRLEQSPLIECGRADPKTRKCLSTDGEKTEGTKF